MPLVSVVVLTPCGVQGPGDWNARVEGALTRIAFHHVLLSFARRPLRQSRPVAVLAFARVAGVDAHADPTGLVLILLGVQCAVIGLLAKLLVFTRNRGIRDHVVGRRIV